MLYPLGVSFLLQASMLKLTLILREHTNMALLQISLPQKNYYLVKPLFCVGVCKIYYIV